MILFPNAKINLGLSVVNRREDGFHNIETVFFPVQLTDILEFIVSPDNKMKFELTGIALENNENNLCLKAYNLLKSSYDLPPLHIHLHKIIPIGAGLGGGSSDGAFMLKGLNELFNLGIESKDLEKMAAMLGSDCPFFIHGQPYYAIGKGEILSVIDLSLKGLYIKIVNPGIFVPTAEAYKGIIPKNSELPVFEIIKSPVSQWKESLVNDFEKVVFNKHPEIKTIKDKLYKEGALYAAMSGSGSSVFGIFDQKPVTNRFDERYFIWDGLL